MPAKSDLKYIQSLGHKKQRDEDGVFIAEGPKIVEELLNAPGMEILKLYAMPEWIEGFGRKLPDGISLQEVSEKDLARISQLSAPNQVLALIKKMKQTPLPDPRKQLVLALDTIQDPGNLGTIIRTADWFGLKAIVCSPQCADRYNPKVVQATMGSISRVAVWYENLAGWMDGQEVPIYGAALTGQSIEGFKKAGAGILVIGNESKGISQAIMERVTVKLTIPQRGGAESLNAAVAAGILMAQLT